jgi:hypothetical protein
MIITKIFGRTCIHAKCDCTHNAKKLTDSFHFVKIEPENQAFMSANCVRAGVVPGFISLDYFLIGIQGLSLQGSGYLDPGHLPSIDGLCAITESAIRGKCFVRSPYQAASVRCSYAVHAVSLYHNEVRMRTGSKRWDGRQRRQ